MIHSVKSVQIRSYFWSVFSCIQSEYRKIQTRNNSLFGHFSRSDYIDHIITDCYCIYIWIYDQIINLKFGSIGDKWLAECGYYRKEKKIWKFLWGKFSCIFQNPKCDTWFKKVFCCHCLHWCNIPSCFGIKCWKSHFLLISKFGNGIAKFFHFYVTFHGLANCYYILRCRLLFSFFCWAVFVSNFPAVPKKNT